LLDGIQASGFIRAGVESGTPNTAANKTTFTCNDAMETSSGNQSGLQVWQDTAGADAFMTFHVAGDYAGYFGLDGSTNDLSWGGWSNGNGNKYRVFHAGNSTNIVSLGTITTGTWQGTAIANAYVANLPASKITSGTISTARLGIPSSGDWFSGGAAVVATDGVMEIGRYIDFHNTDTSTDDYHIRLDCESTSVLNVTGGTLEVGGSRVLTVGDEGSGNGLDADTLDGVQGASFLRSDADDTASGQYNFTKVNDHAIKVGTIRGTVVGSQSGQYMQLYERVHIGSPSGWGSRNAPSYGLSTYGGALLATDTGNVGIGLSHTTTPVEKLSVAGNIRLENQGNGIGAQ
jgi:hypothetical protein